MGMFEAEVESGRSRIGAAATAGPIQTTPAGGGLVRIQGRRSYQAAPKHPA